MMKRVFIWGLAIDSLTNSPIVILKETDGERRLPIWIGLLEAKAIASELDGIKYFRPMTHDLFQNIMNVIDVKVKKIEVCDLRYNTFYAMITIDYEGKEITIDARPSDAMALSLRIGAPIFVSEQVFQQAQEINLSSEAEDKSEKGKKWQKILEDIDPGDFGNT
jgi:bifunctional DNase/RNase